MQAYDSQRLKVLDLLGEGESQLICGDALGFRGSGFRVRELTSLDSV